MAEENPKTRRDDTDWIPPLGIVFQGAIAFQQHGKNHRQRLSQDEKCLLSAAAYGDVEMVTNYVTNCNVNLAAQDSLGRTAFILSIVNNQNKVVEYLIDVVSLREIYDGLICALRGMLSGIALFIIHHQRYEQLKWHTEPETNDLTSVQFDLNLELSPLEVAAQENLFIVVQSLLEKGERILPPHESTKR
ncbi:short transient receptor potential channel 6-like [Tubulanus polymorphus]|uniref:short transient receptor potential channel 6-like n=1 Tax=Tubulanus polymorphus TaxID=672921 RepID=UPI003DA3D9A6